MPDWSTQNLLSILRAEGPQTPASLIARLGTSQPTLFRAVQSQPDAIVALGARINRKLAAIRDVRGLGREIPIFRVSEEGEIQPLGHLVALHPTASAVVLDASPNTPQLYPGLPFFLDDMRPQGFLGRAFGLKHAELRLPNRIVDWSSDDILEALARRGEDLVGDLLVGAESFERFQKLGAHSEAIDAAANPGQAYAQLADAAEAGEPAGSSAGGEQPKFGAALRGKDKRVRRVLVKFSSAGSAFAAERWRDLLICESLALELLRENGIEAAEGRLIEAGGRTFLETVRFDRVGARGRKGMLSLAALEHEWVSRSGTWAVSALALESGKKISKADLQTIQKLECFGRLIANSDRHSGNLSFFWNPGEAQAKLAPVYDMLPMLYAPNSRGEDSKRTFELPTYDHTLLGAWKQALPMALSYWERVRADARLSQGFRKIAEQNLGIVSAG